MQTRSRPAVRIVCLDAHDRVLLLRWQDPSNLSLLWEPPGGGIEPGETAYAAAIRELAEETGLDPSSIVDAPIVVERDDIWNGTRWVGPESFFLACFRSLSAPQLSAAGLQPDEVPNLRGYAWLSGTEIASLTEPVVPGSLLADIVRLEPDWCAR